MEKTKRPLIFIAIIVLAIAIVETANYLIPVPTTVSVTDRIGDTEYYTIGELPFMDIVEVTVERNEPNLTITIKVNGDIPNQTESSNETNITYTYGFEDFIRLDLNGNQWIPKQGHYQYKAPWSVDYAGEDFPGSYKIDHEGRMIQIILDLDVLRERGVSTDVTSEAFRWYVDSIYIEDSKMRYLYIGCDGVGGYFPDYLSFHRSLIHILAVIIIVVGGVAWWLRASMWKFLTGKTWGETQLPKQVGIIEVTYFFHSIYWLVIGNHFLHKIPPAGSYMGGTIGMVYFGISFYFFLAYLAFFLTALGILEGKRWTRKFGLTLSILAVIYGLYPLAIELGINFFPFLQIRPSYLDGFPIDRLIWKSLDLAVGATSLLCIYYLTRPQVKAFLVKSET